MGKSGKARGCLGGLILGSVLRALVFIFSALIKGLASVMVFFGLWAPFFYAVFGGVLYLVFKFDPFSGSIDSKIYLAGFAGTVLCAILITIRHLFEKPAQSIAEGFKKPIWKKRDEEDELEEPRKARRRKADRFFDDEEYEEAPPVRKAFERRRAAAEVDYEISEYKRLPASVGSYEGSVSEKPRIYFSAVEEDVLVHEYSDRFEVFRVVNGKVVPDRVEYKNL